jgi:hypothetical protein
MCHADHPDHLFPFCLDTHVLTVIITASTRTKRYDFWTKRLEIASGGLDDPYPEESSRFSVARLFSIGIVSERKCLARFRPKIRIALFRLSRSLADAQLFWAEI